jgi:acyl-CoA thioester hydrolase
MSSKFIQNRIVKKEHIDQLNHVNNIQYLQWAQEISKSHWNHLIDALDKPFGVWMVRSHQVEYRLNVAEGETIRIETHVGSVRGPLSNRVVEFYSESSQKLLVQCQTQWCYIDLKDRSVVQIPESIKKLFLG